MNKKNNGRMADCDYLNLSSIRGRCKRYDANYDGHSSKVKLNQQPCSTHGNIPIEDCIFKLDNPKKFISFICFLV